MGQLGFEASSSAFNASELYAMFPTFISPPFLPMNFLFIHTFIRCVSQSTQPWPVLWGTETAWGNCAF
jgi:hypothetical protein